jgi:hypothetical protein
VEGKAPRDVMALLDCAAPGLDLVQSVHFTALEGTRTFAMRLRDVFVSEAQVLADPVEGFIPRIRAGFVLLQLGMALGLVQGCIDNIERSGRSRREINRYLPDQVPDLTEALDALRTETLQLARTPWEADPSYMHRVWRARLTGAELSLRAAQGAMLHAGASGYTVDAPAQRRLREAYFIAIVTPSVKHLHKVLTTATAFSDVHHAKEALRMT